MSSPPKIGGKKAEIYRAKLKSRNALEIRIADLRRQLKDAKHEFAQIESDIETMRKNSKLPILIFMVTDTERVIDYHKRVYIDVERTIYTYYLLDLDMVISYARYGDGSDKHPLKGTCDLTSMVSSNLFTRAEAAEEISNTATNLIQKHHPQTWAQLKKLLKAYYLNP